MSKLLTKRKGELYNMEKRKTTLIFVIGVILIVSTFLICHKHTAYQTQLDEVKLKDIEENNMFAIMVKGSDGEYAPSDKFPEKGYKLNKDKSGCMDNNNQLIPDSLSYDEDSQQVIVSTGQTSYCYLYFDKELPKTLQTLQSKASSGLSEGLIGGMYRYQGADVNNYICLGKLNDTNCGDKSDSMYRIIGITEEGNIKVMKQTKYNKGGTTTFKWNTNYHDNSLSNNYCGTNGCPEWPDSTIFNTLNGSTDSFLSKLSDDIKNKIADWEWYYGDIENSYANKTADEIYQIEIGQADTQYYGKTSSNPGLVRGQRWQKMVNTAKIGLIYLHDYYYQSTTSNNCHNNGGKYEACKTGGWMHISKNGGTTSDYEWTMSRIGRDYSSSTTFRAWCVYSSGCVEDGSLHTPIAVRPVYYLTSDVELEGTGEVGSPFYIKS